MTIRTLLALVIVGVCAHAANGHDVYRTAHTHDSSATGTHDHAHGHDHEPALAQASPPKPARGEKGKRTRIEKPTIADTLIANMYADNWFKMYINGELVCVDSIRFMPHNVISVNVFPEYPMTIAVMAKDNADAKTGMEYNNSNIGDGGFILKFSDGTVTNSRWKVKKVSWGPLDGDTKNPRTVHIEIPTKWYTPDFDDSQWKQAREYSEENVRPKKPFYDHDFKGAKFIWSDDLELDNTILFRHTVKAPPNGNPIKPFPGLDNPNGNEPKLRVPEENQTNATLNNTTSVTAVADNSKLPADAPAAAKAFARYNPNAKLRWDEKYLYVESDGLPNHQMMVGITAWQQQVPLPQPYTGGNAWRIPLKLVPAKEPMSAKTNFFRGAIALAVNGVPIFNPIKNDGRTDTLLAGELDQWGGHCGRGDDYHYHIAPVHLEKIVGKGNPIAYALDGYPILGYEDAKGSTPTNLDWLNGHKDGDGHYHYHATKTYPYLNGGFYGEVTERGGQVDPQPRAAGVRPYTRPLRGAKITGFKNTGEKSRTLTYEIDGKEGSVHYNIAEDGSVNFKFVDVTGKTSTKTYQPRQPGGRDRTEGGRGERPAPPAGRDNGGQNDRKGPPTGNNRLPWIAAHFKELDTDSDKVVTSKEMTAEGMRAFAGYDRNGDNKLSKEEYDQRGQVKSAIAGFIRGHADEIDTNNDTFISRDEMNSLTDRMFNKADRDRDGKVTLEEASRRGSGGKGKDRPPKDQRTDPTGDATTQSSTAAIQPTEAVIIEKHVVTADPGKRKPNFVLFLIDDMGWRDMGFAGNTVIETPHTDKLAREGVIFTQAYASAPNCAPTRACLLSGQYPPRHGVYTVVDERHSPGLPHHKIIAAKSNAAMSGDVVTIAEALKEHGYATACYGMWNLGRGRKGPSTPTGQGFDQFFQPKGLGFEKDAYIDRDGNYLTDRFTDEGIRFIEASRDRPFFLYLPYHAVHAPYEPKPDLLKKYQKKGVRDPHHAATVEAVDQNVGRIMATLRKLHLDENTVVLFTSDNGGTRQYTSPLNGGKGQLYEGGLRVPTCVWWSGIQKPGRSSDTPILSMDFYPTMLDIAGIPEPDGHRLDGESMLPILENTGDLKRDTVFWHFPCYIGSSSPCSAIRVGDFKLIRFFERDHFELYNLKLDPLEKNDLAKTKPEKVQELDSALRVWWDRTGAALPTGPNPRYDPNAERPRGRQLRKPQSTQKLRRK